MKTAILAKINEAVADGVTKEAEVLYILAQCRKYIESTVGREEGEKNYPTLSLVGDWVLHAKLDRGGAKRKLKEYADFLDSQDENVTFDFMTSGFKLFSDLKADLSRLVDATGINDKLKKDMKFWRKFVSLLIQILRDLPLESRELGMTFVFDEGFIIVEEDRQVVSFSINHTNGMSNHFTIDIDVLV